MLDWVWFSSVYDMRIYLIQSRISSLFIVWLKYWLILMNHGPRDVHTSNDIFM